MSVVTQETVRERFDGEARGGRRLLPDDSTVTGLGTMVKYRRAVGLMAGDSVASVLDVGCNRGSIEALFHREHPAKAVRTAITGIDISEEAIAQARMLELPGCTFRSYDGVSIGAPDGSFDLVVMVEVIEHVLPKETLLREIHRVLKPGGRLFLTTPNPECWTLRFESAIWRLLRTLFRRPQPQKDAFITGRALDDLLHQVGLARQAGSGLYYWPHLFIGFLGWSLFPPLPPRLLYAYQRWWAGRFESAPSSGGVARRAFWTVAGVWQRGSAAA
jgi:2-polyprenyl-3-methyl-5-hydroxy-6-metoxy-1,4-benzoquinol methylase